MSKLVDRKMTAGEYGTPTHYLKGKDIKQQGDCLVYCYTRRIENISEDWNDQDSEWEQIHKPEGFETIKVNDKW